ncbi:MAG: fibronectin type III domain-containing protein [Ruminococcaceae bacterium]|nr:fibronectin type III domain-containing protein [Oscillospiraceae bacterium]
MKAKKYIFCLITVIILLLAAEVAAYGADHQHVFSALYTAVPTCTEKGYTVFSCDCGYSFKGDMTDSLGHNYSKETVCFKQSSCTEKGEGGRYCLRCYAKTDTVFYGKTAHTPVYVTEKATLKKDGEKRKECSVCKKLYSSKAISKASSVKLERKTYTYDGKVKTPDVTVKDSKGNLLKKGTDYTLKYQKGRKKTGSYSVRVTLKGNYEGTKTLYFKIRPAAVKSISAVPSLTSVLLSWSKAKGSDGYEIYLKGKKNTLIKDTEKLSYTVKKLDGKKLESGKEYTFIIKGYKKSGDERIYSASKKIKVVTKPQKAKIRKLTASSGKITVKSVKQSCRGYEILISTNKSFSNAKSVSVKSGASLSYTFKNLIKGKKYYVKIRAYVVSGGEKYCGYYSDVKTVKA